MASFLKDIASTKDFRAIMKKGPSLMKDSTIATSGERDLGDTGVWENTGCIVGKAPCSKPTLYEWLKEKADCEVEDLDIKTISNTPRNAVFYGKLKGKVNVKGEEHTFEVYFLEDEKVDTVLSEFD